MPQAEATIEEMLARPALKWSVGHWAKNARDVRPPPVADKEKQARGLEKAKMDLLKANEELNLLRR